ncbi:FAD binding domain of DNA photolyase domain-containing protein [Phthorimaea operculella]|nr:FAD binding domain of DNA photolyase domain-containing protein [Phthorimaea operculella]
MLGGSVLWFRHGLRLHDNPALHAAVEDRNLPFFPIFIFDGETAGTKTVGYNRMRYLLEALNDLDQQFRQYGGRLIMMKGKPDVVFRRLWEEFGIRKLCFEQDCEPVWRPRDDAVKKICRETGIAVHEKVGHTLWAPDTVIKANGGIPPLTYQMFLHTVTTIGDPPRPVPDVDLRGVTFGTLPDSFYREFGVFDKVPKPEDLGVNLENEDIRMIRWVGGETTALKQMSNRLVVEYETFRRGSYLPTHGNPDLLGPPISLSPALRFGCLSVRKATHSITGQLIWREYFYTMSVNNPNYGQMAGNPICLDIPWKEPEGDELKRWTEGKTGFPFVDAAMRQLRAEGWLHHVVRNTVASFLTRGTLWLSWEHGLQHFLKYLLDADCRAKGWLHYLVRNTVASFLTRGTLWLSWEHGLQHFLKYLLDADCYSRAKGWLHHVVRNTVASFLTRGTLWLSWEHGLQHFLKYLLDADWNTVASFLTRGTLWLSWEHGLQHFLKYLLDADWNTVASFLTRGTLWLSWEHGLQHFLKYLLDADWNTVASFLTRGTLWLSWEHGLQHFLKYLLDADWSVCAGNWMWVSSSAFEALLDSGECACPVTLGQRLDPSGEYVRRYVPELCNIPVKYIYEPWKTPVEIQQRAGCIIGVHYPAPLVNHLAAAQRNRNAMKELRSYLQKAPPHCCPSSEDEIRQFMWLNEEPALEPATVATTG